MNIKENIDISDSYLINNLYSVKGDEMNENLNFCQVFFINEAKGCLKLESCLIYGTGCQKTFNLRIHPRNPKFRGKTRSLEK